MKNACVLKTHMILYGFHCNIVHKKVLNKSFKSSKNWLIDELVIVIFKADSPSAWLL